jgi:hypothetical protein
MLQQRVGVSLCALVLGLLASAPALAVTAPGTSCLVHNEGLDAASARSGGRIVCQEIQQNGVRLAPDGSDTADAYRVRFEQLGRHVIVSVSYESPPGTVARTRRVLLNGPEELTQAGPRVATAIVNDTPLEDTAKVDNLVGQETRRYKKKHGEFLWGPGILGATLPSGDVVAAPGIELMGMYETPAYGVGISLRTTLETDDENTLFHASLGIGGRYFFGSGDIAPFAGGGIAISHLSVQNRAHADYYYSSGMEGSGFGAFAEGGVEFLRLHSTRLIVALRVDAPFYRLETSYGYSYDASGAPIRSPAPTEEYHVPITLAATYAW